SGNIRARDIQRAVEGVARVVEANDKKLQRNLDRAQAAMEKEDRRGALRQISSNLGMGLVGLPAQEATVRLYHEILDAARTEMNKMVEEGNAEGLKALAGEFRRTSLEKEIDEAMKKLG